MSQSLKKIRQCIEPELIEFERKFKKSMKSNVALLDRIMYYIVQRKGKQVRPMFVFLSAKMLGEINESTYRAASLVELLHTATLVHDDVVDNANKRRGMFSINALWKNKIAVLVGDYLLSKGLLLSLENKEYDLLQIVSKAVKQMSEGELLQIEKTRKLNITEDIYYDIIQKKTASLIASACASGASSITKDIETIERVRSFGEYIGMAFQIKDDLFDLGIGDSGKPTNTDLKEKKMTLPLIHAMQNAKPSDVRSMKQMVNKKKKSKEELSSIHDFISAHGGIEYAKKKMEAYKSQALEQLHDFENNEAKIALLDLVEFIVERKY